MAVGKTLVLRKEDTSSTNQKKFERKLEIVTAGLIPVYAASFRKYHNKKMPLQ